MEKSRISRRGMLKGAAAALLALDGSVSAVSSAAAAEQLPLVQKTPVIGSKNVTGQKVEGSVAKVYFSPVIDAASLIKLYNLVNEEIYDFSQVCERSSQWCELRYSQVQTAH